MLEAERHALGQRLRRARIRSGITVQTAAKTANVTSTTWTRWEQGSNAYHPSRLLAIAAALDVPVVSLLSDRVCVAEVFLSEASLERVRTEGRHVAGELAKQIASNLEPLIYAAATTPEPDIRPGARAAKKRQTRAEKLRGIKAANKARTAARARREIE